MIYTVRHITIYRYTLVTTARCVLRLIPRSDKDQALITNGQTLLESAMEILPVPVEYVKQHDFFGNPVVFAFFETKHRELRVIALAHVEVNRPPPPDAASTLPWEEVARLATEANSLTPDSPVHGLFPSGLVPLINPARLYAQTSFPPNRPILEGANDLMRRIWTDFKYDPGATIITTPLEEVFENKHGVCQDFAHAMISCLRSIGIPALYVSGYIRTIPPAGQPRLEGADASHAWVAIWCGPEIGWTHLDPTNNIHVQNDHIVLAIGRDYRDVSPVYGIFVGASGQSLSVSVDVAPINPETSKA